MRQVLLFLLTFGFVFLLYQFLLIGKNKRRNSKGKPMEVKYLEVKYKIDIKKLDYKKLLRLIAIISSLDIAIIVTIAFLFQSYLIELIVATILVIPVILFSYSFVGKYYQKKGMIKDESI